MNMYQMNDTLPKAKILQFQKPKRMKSVKITLRQVLSRGRKQKERIRNA